MISPALIIEAGGNCATRDDFVPHAGALLGSARNGDDAVRLAGLDPRRYVGVECPRAYGYHIHRLGLWEAIRYIPASECPTPDNLAAALKRRADQGERS